VHGELYALGLGILLILGSSPRAWGTHLRHHGRDDPVRFIPTCMGNSVGTNTRGAIYDGSSPRAWGTPKQLTFSPLQLRFIPTCMGNSRSAAVSSGPATVHPHVHGELESRFTCDVPVCGSSPRAWGTRQFDPRLFEGGRFIPTCMGNSRLSRPTPIHMSVHPHVHGELVIAEDRGVHALGSSPRAWGTRYSPDRIFHYWRFIPTCMGNSLYSVGRYPQDTVHPHVHGELTARWP